MKVYVVIIETENFDHDYGYVYSHELDKIFSSKEKAEYYIQTKELPEDVSYDIREMEVE